MSRGTGEEENYSSKHFSGIGEMRNYNLSELQ